MGSQIPRREDKIQHETGDLRMERRSGVLPFMKVLMNYNLSEQIFAATGMNGGFQHGLSMQIHLIVADKPIF